MKAQIGTEQDLTRPHTLFEPKLDGIRALCYVNTSLVFYSRNTINITADYPEFEFRKAIKAQSAILDGEIVVLDEQLVPRFQLWQQGYPARYIVFDIVMLNDQSLINLPLTERKKILDKTVVDTDSIEKIIFTHNGIALWQEMIKRGMEGVIAKNAFSSYEPGKRSQAWLKIKLFKTIEALIVGYIVGKRGLGSLALGIYDTKGQLIYIGNVGTGFSMDFLNKIDKALRKIEIKEPVVKNGPKGIIWVQPILIAEIKYTEFTFNRTLRSPVFLRLRFDKKPEEITFKDQGLKN